MKSTNKGNQCHMGMMLYVGAVAKTGLVRAVIVTSANVRDKHALPGLLHGKEMRVYGDRGYQGCTELIKEAAPPAKDFTNRRVRKPLREDEVALTMNRAKNRTRPRLKHVFLVLKRQFGFAKACDRGLAKNANPVFMTLVLVNLVMALRPTPGLTRP